MATIASTGSAHLMSGRLNVAQVLAAAQTELLELLGDPAVKKVLVWDQDLISPMSLIAEPQFIRSQGVAKMVRLPAPTLTELYPEGQEYIFLVRPTLSVVEKIADAIRTSKLKQNKKFIVAFTPNKAQHCVSKLKEYGFVHGSKTPLDFSITEYHLDILPLESDVMSLDIPSAFKDLFVDHDPTPVYRATRAIAKLQALFGVIPKIYGKGRNAKMVADLMKSVQQELQRSQVNPSRRKLVPTIDALVLLDRTVDMVTPLSTQLTYEGLINEIYGIKHSVAVFPREMFSEEVQQNPKEGPAPSGPLPLRVNAEDNMYSVMRDINFRAVGHFLSSKAKDISAQFASRHDAKTVSQLRVFVEKLPHMQQLKQSLSKHTTVAELIKTVTDKERFLDLVQAEHEIREEEFSDRPHPYVEKLLGNTSQHPIEKVLKLICLQSAAGNGLRPKLLETYKREVLHAYGYHHLNTLLQLEKAGLLRSQEEKGGLLRAQETRGFPSLKKQLQLITTEVNEINPQDLSYLFSGYAPLSIKLMEVLEKQQGFATFEELTRQLPGPPAFLQTQHNEHKHRKMDRTSIVLVFFLGGVTHAEISGLRFLSQRDESSVEYVVGTTHIINGTSLLGSLMQDTPFYNRPGKLWDNQVDDDKIPQRERR